ncbi:mannose-1-phosphate guanylyltransferase [Erythrobacter sp. SCSIO 43205]|uniref:mannose-1-phosphate guanylyltransferase n=1 Tax=Erythrobacter sp. SCSIO 43205 TaxID=2779361 RepID=UPI0021062BA9|nr:sugar phosphate nucleotidyltransferase [Erythrobacter sp. SCSIO 43205]
MIYPVILCGGSGTRLWPVSLKAKPKPFLPLVGQTSLFEQACARVADDARFGEPVIVAGAAHEALITEQMDGKPHRLIIEPAARNTAPAIALAAEVLDPDAIMLVCPSDHYIAKPEALREAAVAAAALAAKDYLTTFGITADRPETGYGYIRHGRALDGGFAVAEFVEKPDLERAKSYLASGEYSWNGGIFAFRAGAYLDALAQYRPAMAKAVKASVAGARSDGSVIHPAPEEFAGIEGDSVDYAVMENTPNAAMVPADMGWSDIGNWAALQDALIEQEGNADDQNVVRGRADLADCTRVLAMSDGPRVSAVGLEDVCIVVANGEVLVTTRDGAQKVGKLPGAKDQ